jgi:hypothetical protein
MTADGTELYILYQMGASEDWIWFSPIGVFLSEKALWDYVRMKGMPSDLRVLEPSTKNDVLLTEPQEFVIVRSKEGEVPDVDLKESDNHS